MSFIAPVSKLLLLGFMAAATSGCAVLFGNVKPVEEKSVAYGYLDLAQADPQWQRLEQDSSPSSKDSGTSTAEVSDVAFQSTKTASIISLNTACRSVLEDYEKDLHHLTDLLLLGFTDVHHRQERELDVHGAQGLETTVQGKFVRPAGLERKLRTVVVQRGNCIYDLVYVATPERFETNEADFSQFVASLRLR